MDITELLTFAHRSGASDCHLAAMEPPRLRINGDMKKIEHPALSPEEVHTMVFDIMSDGLRRQFQETNDVDFSFELGDLARFRVNVFRGRRGEGAVFRTIPTKVMTVEDLGLPNILKDICDKEKGLVLVTGPTGSGKSTTLAAMIDYINESFEGHILTIEDPIEFVHGHKKATIHQRELHSDTPTFSLALRAALRQAPKVILVGEMRDRETMEIALEAAETGHLVMSTLHTIDASKSVERIVGAFPLGDQQAIRTRLARTFQYVVSQRLVPRADASGRVAVLEVLKSTLRTRDYVEKGEADGKTLLDAMRDGAEEGMQHFDGELERLIRAGIISIETGLSYATNVNNLRLDLTDYIMEQRAAAVAQPA